MKGFFILIIFALKFQFIFRFIFELLLTEAIYVCLNVSLMLHFKTFLRKETSSWVTFVHGAGGSSAIWYKQLRDFKKEYNVLLIDLRGHGKSKSQIYQKLKSYTFDAISDEVIEVLDHLKIQKSHFVGISLGTIIIREIAERFPKRCESLILGGAVMKLNFRGQVLMRLGVLLKSVIPYLLLYKFFAIIIMPVSYTHLTLPTIA